MNNVKAEFIGHLHFHFVSRETRGQGYFYYGL